MGCDKVEKIDGCCRSLLVRDALGSDLSGEQRKQCGKVCRGCEFRLLLAERVFDGGKQDMRLQR
jgi:hypothetical protein